MTRHNLSCDKTMLDRVADASWALRDNLTATYEDYARAAIAAMREPTPAMVKAGWEKLAGGGHTLADIWRAMIDAALAEEAQ
jgi:hypothetical protein